MDYSPPSAKRGVTIALLFVLIPLLIWISVHPLRESFGSIPAAWLSIGQILGLSGISLYAATLILSTRLAPLERFTGGLDRLFTVHHSLGTSAFICLLFHPLSLAMQYAVASYQSALRFLIPGSQGWEVLLGTVALLGMLLVLLLTFYGKIAYHRWKISHQSMGAFFLLGSLHAFLVPSDISESPVLRGYMLLIVGLALAAYTYRTVFGRFLVRKYAYTVASVEPLSDSLHRLNLEAKHEEIRYEPGQFAFVSFPGIPGGKEAHPFTMASAPDRPGLTFVIKSLGDYTARIPSLTEGTEALVEGPYGTFSYKCYRPRQIWIAGGIGITPFLSFLAHLSNRPGEAATFHIDLYHSVKTAADLLMDDVILNLTKELPGIMYHPYVSEESGYITVPYIHAQSGNLLETDFLLCGPPGMVEALTGDLLSGGIYRHQIHSEQFSL